VLLAVAVGIGYLSWLGVVERRIPGAWFSPANADFWQVAPRLVSLALVAHALIRVYVGAGSDLVLARLRLRYALLLVAGTYMLIELLAGSEGLAGAKGGSSIRRTARSTPAASGSRTRTRCASGAAGGRSIGRRPGVAWRRRLTPGA
jgi:hypothetical protein